MTILAVALVFLPLGLLAAPYADFVIDARTGEVLHQTNADTRLHPASLTKMMTLYICFEAIEHGEISLDTMVTVSKFAASQPPSRLGLRAGQKIALRYLIRAAAVKSANDAAAAIGDAIEGNKDAFARRMNRTAQALGMTRTTFKNPNGLTAQGHLSTARDMTTLGRRLFYDFPQYYSIFSRRSADAGVAQVASTNRRFLDAYEGADGIKTGYTAPAGFNLVASAERGNKRIIATVFGGTSTAMRNARAAELLDLGFHKAPNRVAEQRPPAIAYQGNVIDKAEVAVADAPTDGSTDEPGEDFLANAIAGDVNADAPAAGKTVRVQMAVNQSPRPRTRSGATPAVPAGTADAPAPAVLAAAPADQDQAIAAEATDMASATDNLLAGMQDTINQALAEAQDTSEGSGFAQTTAPQPETLALAGADPSATQPAANVPAVDTSASVTAPGTSLHPRARPETQIASAAPDASTLVDAAPVIETPQQASVAPEGDLPQAGDDLLQAADNDQVQLEDAIQLASSPKAAAAPEKQEIILAAATAAPSAEPIEQEVVTRVSTSGGREWGINVGTFTTRDRAERQLLHTALAEMSTLNDSLRKVTPKHGAFDANFIGMTEETAAAACQRIAARGSECKVIGPGA